MLMTMPDDLDLTTDLQEALAEPTPEVTEEVTTDIPETPEEPTTPAAPQLDLTQQVAELVQMQRAQIEAQQAQARQAAQPAPAAWVDPFERPDNVARLADLEERAVYDPAAMRELNAFNRQLMQEQFRHDLETERQTIRQEMEARQVYEQATGTLRSEAARYGDLVDSATLTEVENEVLSTVPAHQRAMALQDPAFRKLLTEAAAGRRVLSGKQVPPSAPARQAAPPSVQSSGRTATPVNTDPKQEAVKMWTDQNYLAGTMEDLLFGKQSKRTTDHEELLK